MCFEQKKQCLTPIRCHSGQAQVEFSAIFAFMVLFVLLPLADMAAVPVRMLYAQRMFQLEADKISKFDKLSTARTAASSGDFLGEINALGGVAITDGPTLSVGSDNMLMLHAKVQISPLYSLDFLGLPIAGLTGPTPDLSIDAISHWEHLGVDPQSQVEWVNE